MATFKSLILLLLLTLFLSSAFLSMGFRLRSPRKELSGLLPESTPESPRREHEYCLQQCREEQGHGRQQQCQLQCEERIREREQEEKEEDDPRQQYEQCQEHCRRQPHDQSQGQRCQQRCQKEYEERQEFDQCRERCQRLRFGQRLQEQCRQRCQREYDQRLQEEESRRDNSQHPCQKCKGEEEESRREREQDPSQQREEEEESSSEGERDPRQRREEEEEEESHREREQDPRRRREEEEESSREGERDARERREEEEEEEEEESRHEREQDPRQRREEEEESGRERERDPRQRRQEEEEEEESRRESGQDPRHRRQEEEESRHEHKQDPGQRREEESSSEHQQDPSQQFKQCRERCRRQQHDHRQQQRCQRTCREQFKEQQESSESEQEQRSSIPFLFRSRTFHYRFRSKQGGFRVVPRFNRRSQLLRGIKNYRFSILEANPNTFVIPHHSDSEALYVVVRGQGKIAFVNDERRQSFILRSGTVIRVPAGTTVYIVNAEKSEKLVIAALRESVNAPGHTQEFFLSGRGGPVSYLDKYFSSRIVEASWNCSLDQMRKLFREQSQDGMIRKASPEQLKALSAQYSSSPKHSESYYPIELLNQRAVYSNENGLFHEARPAKYRQLRFMDVSVSALQLNNNSIFLPHFNSRQTMLLLITEGFLDFEIISPQLQRDRQEERREEKEEQEEEGEQEQESGQCQKVAARANTGDLLVLLADYPVALVAPRNQNAKAIGFGINAENNERIFLAGQNNIVKNLEKAAQELSFGTSPKLVDQVFNNQQESYFASASRQRQQKEEEDEDRRGNRLSSILDIARLF